MIGENDDDVVDNDVIADELLQAQVRSHGIQKLEVTNQMSTSFRQPVRPMSHGSKGNNKSTSTSSSSSSSSSWYPFKYLFKAMDDRKVAKEKENKAKELANREAARAKDISWPFDFTHIRKVTLDSACETGFQV